MSNTGRDIQGNPAASEQQLLPADKDQALTVLINITENLINFSERESQVLAQNDMMTLAVMQDEKTLITQRYVALSTEFRKRLEEFRGVNPALLDRLETLQNTLGENSRHNNTIIGQMQDRAKKKTEGVLMNAHKLGQSHPVKFAGDTLLALNEQKEDA
ncbi:MAG: hypothetical protein ACLFR0_00095 [Alphaproteobacteria bacterium]